MAGKARWVESDIQNGFVQVRLRKWRFFMDYVYQEMLDYETYIWRGQRCDDWALSSTLDRLIEKVQINEKRQPKFRRSHLEKFKYAVRGRRGSNPAPIKEENEWWALGQHHGLATPLLDWTTSPFVAAYFAFIGTGPHQTRHRAVYALYRPGIEREAKNIMREEEKQKSEKRKELQKTKKTMELVALAQNAEPAHPEVEFIRPRSDENQRLVCQSGLFTRAPNGRTFEEWVQRHFVRGTTYTLIKILIPNRDREDCLRTLNRMNINHLTLFPDLYGASKFCNLFGEIERY